jgi:hypothetical protein
VVDTRIGDRGRRRARGRHAAPRRRDRGGAPASPRRSS